MATEYAEIRTYIRTLLGDQDSSNFFYSNDDLDAAINFILLVLNDPTIEASILTPGEFTTELTGVQKVLISANVALNLIALQAEDFSFKTIPLSVHRRLNHGRLIFRLEYLLELVNGGKLAIAVDYELDAIVNGLERFIDNYESAFS